MAAMLTFAQLYKSDPEPQGAIDKAEGYAVFSDLVLKIILLGGAKGVGWCGKQRREA
jgi:hypothetical protein